jgi:hypothetical protein
MCVYGGKLVAPRPSEAAAHSHGIDACFLPPAGPSAATYLLPNNWTGQVQKKKSSAALPA